MLARILLSCPVWWPAHAVRHAAVCAGLLYCFWDTLSYSTELIRCLQQAFIPEADQSTQVLIAQLEAISTGVSHPTNRWWLVVATFCRQRVFHEPGADSAYPAACVSKDETSSASELTPGLLLHSSLVWGRDESLESVACPPAGCWLWEREREPRGLTPLIPWRLVGWLLSFSCAPYTKVSKKDKDLNRKMKHSSRINFRIFLLKTQQ